MKLLTEKIQNIKINISKWKASYENTRQLYKINKLNGNQASSHLKVDKYKK